MFDKEYLQVWYYILGTRFLKASETVTNGRVSANIMVVFQGCARYFLVIFL